MVESIGAIIADVMRVAHRHWCPSRSVTSIKPSRLMLSSFPIDDDQQLSHADRFGIVREPVGHRAPAPRGNEIPPVHPLDDAYRGVRADPLPDFDEGLGSRFRTAVES